jgi:hypothetical protein
LSQLLPWNCTISKAIKRAVPEDAESIYNIQQKAYQSEAQLYNDYNIAPLKETLEELKQEYSNQVFLKATESDRLIVGSVRAYVKDCT